MTMIDTALIGFGFSARTFHLPFLLTLPQYRVCAASTGSGEYLHLLGEQAEHYSDADRLLEQSDAQLVIITSPNDSHYALARRALEQGRDVVIDKPFVCSVDEGIDLIELARRKQRTLSVYHNRRWDGDFMTVKQLVDSGRLGRIKRFESHFDRFRPQVQARWREQPGRGTGIWYDLGPHLLDQSLLLFGMPEAVTARLACLRDSSGVTDYFHVQLHYPQLEVVLNSSPFCAGPNIRFQLDGNEGSFRKEGLDPQEDRLRSGVLPEDDAWAAEPQGDWGTLYTATDNERVATLCGGYQHYYRQLADALAGEGRNPVPADEALAVMRLIEAAEISDREGRRLAL